MGTDESLWDFVVGVARGLNKKPEEVEPYIQTLENNWFDSADSLIDTKPEELSALGIPLRFAKELVNSAAGGGRPTKGRDSARSSGSEKGKDKGKKGKGKGKDRDKDGRESGRTFQDVIDLEHCEPEFELRSRLLGDRGSNVHHIQDESHSRIFIDTKGENRVEITANSSEDLERAVNMMWDLVNTIMQDYDDWCRENLDHRDRRGGKGKDKGKGKDDRKGKDKGKDDRKGKGKGKGKDKDRGRERDERSETINLEDTDPEFRIKAKIIGEGGKNVHHIQDASGARIRVDERGDRIEVSASSDEDLQNAVNMTNDLVRTIMIEYDQWLQDQDGHDGGRRRKGKDKGKGKGDRKGKDKDKDKDRGKHGGDEFEDVLEMGEAFDKAFRVRAKIVGEGGKNVHHIQDETHAKIQVEYGDAGGVRIVVSGSNQEDVERAMAMCRDLTSSISEEYDQWLDDGRPEEDGKGGRGGKGKDKGKGKRKGKDKDDRPSKRQRTD